jgi:hypothetical protein
MQRAVDSGAGPEASKLASGPGVAWNIHIRQWETFEKHTPHVIPAEAGIKNFLK